MSESNLNTYFKTSIYKRDVINMYILKNAFFGGSWVGNIRHFDTSITTPLFTMYM